MDEGDFAQKRCHEGDRHMRYLLLIYTDEVADANASPEEQAAISQAYYAYEDVVKDYSIKGAALMPTSSATTVRVREGETLISDGPFAETKEQLGGFYLVNCANLDEALALAAQIPGAKLGSIEVRPVMEFE
jgi:hypothetical protein